MYEYEVELSKSETIDDKLSFYVCTTTVLADSETEAIQIIRDNEPEWNIGKVREIPPEGEY